MHSSTIFLATLAATASANLQGPVPIPHAVKRAMDLAPRQTDDPSTTTDLDSFPTESIDPGCSSAYDALYSLATGVPTAAPAITSFVETDLMTVTDVCSVSVPSSLSSDWASYTDALLSWYSSNMPVISSAFAECTSLGDTSTDLGEAGICTSDVAAVTASGSGSASGSATATTTSSSDNESTTLSSSTSSGASKTTSSSSSTDTGAAATGGAAMREVGVVGAVVAGVLGAVVAL